MKNKVLKLSSASKKHKLITQATNIVKQ
jgi:hypothetical protein